MAISGEFSLIEKIGKIIGSASSGVLVGIGDDTAVLAPPAGGGKLLATVDMMVEGVHFNLDWMEPEALGHKALAINLSDIAAMGGAPLYALVSLALPARLSDELIERFYRGMKALAVRFGVGVVGGNLTRTEGPFVVDVTVLGAATENICLRSGTKAGDLVAVTGELGVSAAGLDLLRKRGKAAAGEAAVRRHLMPEPRVEEGKALARSGVVTSMIDVSDGLASELHHLAKSSGVGVLIDETKIPGNLEWAVGGGEDYELLFTIARGKVAPSVAHTIIGEVTAAAEGVRWKRADGKIETLAARGWDHFVTRS